MNTQTKLAQMLKENTGRAMMDSGGAYGRNWERNQGRQFEKEPTTVLVPVPDYAKDGSNFEPEVRHNVFGFLNEALSYDLRMDRRYQAFARKRRKDDYELSIMDAFPEYLADKGHKIGGLYGEGTPMTVNTYNGEDLVSQTLQYLYFECDGEAYVLLQIHGGCDVRGGYTNAVAFQAPDYGTSIFDNARATIFPKHNPESRNQGNLFGQADYPPYWSTDDAWHWYFQGGSGHRDLRDYPISRDIAHKGDGEHVYVDGDGHPHCPMTGLPLEASF